VKFKLRARRLRNRLQAQRHFRGKYRRSETAARSWRSEFHYSEHTNRRAWLRGYRLLEGVKWNFITQRLLKFVKSNAEYIIEVIVID
jgi:hypothetical protein